MPVLDWIGKKAVVNHHREVPYRLLHCDKSKSVGDPDAGNLLLQGDNLEALKALLPYYAGKVKSIYIDPPYNTGKPRRAAFRCGRKRKRRRKLRRPRRSCFLLRYRLTHSQAG
jgi:16S rRNA G966 N2-methylase RsmD